MVAVLIRPSWTTLAILILFLKFFRCCVPVDAPRRNEHARVLLITAALIALVVFALLVPIPLRGRLASASGDLVHAPLFATLTFGAFWLVQYFRPITPLTKRFLLRSLAVVILMIVIGAVSEVAQRSFQRSGSLHDAVANALGISAAWFCYLAWHHKRRYDPHRRGRRLAMLATAGILVGIASWQPLLTLHDMLAARRQFPLIASFESKTALHRWYFRKCVGRFSQQDVTHGTKSMEITVMPRANPGPTLWEIVTDWREIKTLEMDVTLDDSYRHESVELMVKVFDQWSEEGHRDTYYSTWVLKPGQHRHIVITREQLLSGPEGRDLDLSRIRYLALRLLRPGSMATFRVDAIKLTL